jgi:hypothetical protein
MVMATARRNKKVEELIPNWLEEAPQMVEIPGAAPFIISPEDMTCEGAWRWLLAGKELDADAFIKYDDYVKYWLLMMRLTEGTVVVSGDEGSGKSLWGSWISYKLKNLFVGKKVTANFYLSEGFGEYEYLDPASEFQGEMEKLAAVASKENELDDEELFKLLKNIKLYNRVLLFDEAHEIAEKSRRTNLTRALGSLNRLFRHLHNLTIYISQDKEDFDKRMIFNRRTHTISCSHESMYLNTCTYLVSYKRSNFTRMMHLQPADWAHLWKSENIRGLSQSVKIKL